jgi:hypothetical protein
MGYLPQSLSVRKTLAALIGPLFIATSTVSAACVWNCFPHTCLLTANTPCNKCNGSTSSLGCDPVEGYNNNPSRLVIQGAEQTGKQKLKGDAPIKGEICGAVFTCGQFASFWKFTCGAAGTGCTVPGGFLDICLSCADDNLKSIRRVDNYICIPCD